MTVHAVQLIVECSDIPIGLSAVATIVASTEAMNRPIETMKKISLRRGSGSPASWSTVTGWRGPDGGVPGAVGGRDPAPGALGADLGRGHVPRLTIVSARRKATSANEKATTVRPDRSVLVRLARLLSSPSPSLSVQLVLR